MSETLAIKLTDPDLVRDLAQWLADDDTHSWHTAIEAEPTPGSMGVVEILTVLVSSGTAGGLVRALQMWIKHRQPKWRSVSTERLARKSASRRQTLEMYKT